jgi:hypothetical protein
MNRQTGKAQFCGVLKIIEFGRLKSRYRQQQKMIFLFDSVTINVTATLTAFIIAQVFHFASTYACIYLGNIFLIIFFLQANFFNVSNVFFCARLNDGFGDKWLKFKLNLFNLLPFNLLTFG